MDSNYDPRLYPASHGDDAESLPDAAAVPEFHVSPGRSAFFDVIQQIINGLPEEIALLDEQWNILAVNEAWKKTVALLGYAEARPGINYLQFCQAKSSLGYSPATLVAKGIAEIESGKKSSFRFTYEGQNRWAGRTFEVCVRRAEILGRTYATSTRHDVTDMLELRHLREDFSHSVIESQADERRRLAREIHDSPMQLLVALSLTLGRLKRTRQSKADVAIIAETEKLLGDTQRELRAISFLAHPPILEEMGLSDALQALTDGFSRRTGLRIMLHLDARREVGSRAAELALYRVVQEALSNVHRHAHATEAIVSLTRRKSMVHAVITDNGMGLPTPVMNGVGLPGMRARLSEVGGRLTLRRGTPGTTVIASLPCLPDLLMPSELSRLGNWGLGELSVNALGSRLFCLG